MMSDPKMTHAWEQATAGLTEMAAAMGAYHAHLVLSGFTREEALQICIAYQSTMIHGSLFSGEVDKMLAEIKKHLEDH